eukprot:scaffold96583_cov35-Tisochrysis_lutea.AAC.2
MAPAWPMRRPGGAVSPAIKPTTGLALPAFVCEAMKSAACSSALPPISPIITCACKRQNQHTRQRHVKSKQWVVSSSYTITWA